MRLFHLLTFISFLQILGPTMKIDRTAIDHQGGTPMPTSRRTLLKNSAAAAAVLSLDWTRAQAQAEAVRIGVMYDITGPFAAGGSVASSIGTQIAIDLVNEKGGIAGKYKVA